MSPCHVNSKCVFYLNSIKHTLQNKMGWNNILVSGEHRIGLLQISAVLFEL